MTWLGRSVPKGVRYVARLERCYPISSVFYKKVLVVFITRSNSANLTVIEKAP